MPSSPRHGMDRRRDARRAGVLSRWLRAAQRGQSGTADASDDTAIAAQRGAGRHVGLIVSAGSDLLVRAGIPFAACGPSPWIPDRMSFAAFIINARAGG